MSRIQPDNTNPFDQADLGPRPDGGVGLTLTHLSTNLHDLDSALAAMTPSTQQRIGEYLHAETVACVATDPPQTQQTSALETAVNQIPAAARRDLQAILNHQQFSNADLDVLLDPANMRNASLLIMQEVAAIVRRDGAAGLEGQRARRLLHVIRQMRNDGTPICFLIADDPNAPAPLREWARSQIDDDRTRFLQVGQTLFDWEGRPRRARGPDGLFSADYENGELIALSMPHVQLARVRQGVYRLTTEMLGEQRTQEFTDASIQITTAPPSPALQSQGDFITVNLTVNGRPQFGSSLLIRPAPDR
jgi:hypothetical protein